MSESRIEIRRNDSAFWAMVVFLMCMFGKCTPSSPSYYEQWLHAAYGYKVESIDYGSEQ